MGIGCQLCECARQLVKAAAVGFVGEEVLLLRRASVDRWLFAGDAGFGRVEPSEDLLEGFKSANDGGGAEVVFVLGAEVGGEELELLDIEMAQALAQREGCLAAEVGEFTLETGDC